MTHRAEARRTIPVPAADLWQTVSRMDGMEDWYPGLIQKSEVLEPQAAQPRRECVMVDGGELKERILLRDEKTRTFVYAIDEHPLPAGNVVGTIRIDDLGDGTSSVSWSSDLVLDDTNAEQMREMVSGMYAKGLEGLERYHAG